MKNIFSTSFTQLLAHRRLLTVLIILVLFAVATAVYIGMTIEASDLRIITHYTAYGATHFYRDSWTYLLSFIVFVLLSTIFGIGICLKLLSHQREPLAVWFGWTSVVLVGLTLLTYIHLTKLV